jgi:hypothetical protein
LIDAIKKKVLLLGIVPQSTMSEHKRSQYEMKKVVMDEQDAKRLKDLAQYLKTRHHDWL